MTPRPTALTDRALALPSAAGHNPVVSFPPASVRRFNFYGFQIELGGSREDVIHEVVRDFTWFVAEVLPQPPRADMRIRMHCADPPYATLPAVAANVFTPRNVSFRHGHTSYIDYFG